MPNYTTNYNLKKPLQTENYNVGDFNGNADIIDTALKNIDDTKVDVEVGKGLSEENYTLIEKNKVANLPDDTNAQLAEKVQKGQPVFEYPTLVNNWIDYDTINKVAYRVNEETKEVVFTGRVKGGISGSYFTTLPLNARPNRNIFIPLVMAEPKTFVMCYINTGGLVYLYGTPSSYIGLDNLRFYKE